MITLTTGPYWQQRWSALRTALDKLPVESFRSNAIGQHLVRQEYLPGEAAHIIDWVTQRVPVSLCADPGVGDPRHVAEVTCPTDARSYLVTPDSCIFAYSAYTLAPFVSLREGRRTLDVVEIGPGYGGQIERLAAARYVRSYISIDSRVAQQVQRYFLAASGCERNLGSSPYYGQILDELMVRCANLVIAAHCFGEMPRATVQEYINMIEHCAKPGTLFYIITWKHEALAHQLQDTCSRLSDYRFDSNWKTLIRGPYPFDRNPCVEILLERR